MASGKRKREERGKKKRKERQGCGDVYERRRRRHIYKLGKLGGGGGGGGGGAKKERFAKAGNNLCKRSQTPKKKDGRFNEICASS